jgi:hypothetical protein
MTNFENLKKMSLEDFAEWLDKYGQFDHSPWSESFAEKYCDNCESIKCKYADAEEKLGFSPFSYSGEVECAYCELADELGVKRCRFFPELEDIPDNKETIKMWLEEEVE